MKRYHFIAIGGSAMHNLALALHDKGYQITGSDDVIYDPSKTRLAEAGLLPPEFGWFPGKITPDLDGVIVGMHAQPDNPELLKAKELNLPLYSYPEFLYEHAKDKKRVVIAGSHGKTTITATLLHVLKQAGQNPDFMVGSLLEGFDRMVKLTAEAPVMILEGDEYPTSPLDPDPKFLHYKPHIALVTGIALDHINKFETWEKYVEQFKRFIQSAEPGGTLIWFQDDPRLQKIVRSRNDLKLIPYGTPPYTVKNKRFYLVDPETRREYPLQIFGKHNMQNLEGARLLANELGVDNQTFYEAVTTFGGASQRLQKIYDDGNTVIIRDFAHAASKVKASVNAVRELYPGKKLIAVQELHTYSSLNKKYLPEYAGAMDPADTAVIFYDPEALRIKRREPIEPEFIKQAYRRPDMHVFTKPVDFHRFLYKLLKDNTVLLLMSSGSLAGLDLETLKPN